VVVKKQKLSLCSCVYLRSSRADRAPPPLQLVASNVDRWPRTNICIKAIVCSTADPSVCARTPKKKRVIPCRSTKIQTMADARPRANTTTLGIKESSLVWPMLTRSNYAEWSMLMKINYEAMEIWEVIELGTNVRRSQDRQAMGALMWSVPKEMWGTLGAKQTVKEAWETVKTMRIRVDRVKEVNIQKLLKEFENIEFKEGESVEDFGMRITNLVANIKSLGEPLEDTLVVKKFLRVVPPRFNQVVVSIEMFCDVKTLSVEDLVGRLRVAEDRFEDKLEQVTDKAGRLLLAEEEWLEKHKHRFQSNSNKNSNSGGTNQWKAKVSNKSKGASSNTPHKVKLTSQGTPRRKGRCRNYGIYGHWAEDCKRPKRDKKDHKQQEANFAVGDVENAALLFAEVQDSFGGTSQEIHLSEEKVVPAVCSDEVWVLDTGASNHMTGTKSTLSQLDDTVSGLVKFGDGSTVKICGLGSVVMKTRQGDHKVLTTVYYIPQLKSNIISLGQLEEAGCDIRLFAGRLKVFDLDNKLLVSAPRTGNRLYTVQLSVIPPVCLLTRLDDAAWLWHSRFGHLNFKALRNLGVKGMVEGMPVVDRLEQVCDACTLGKQHRAPFPKASVYRAKRGIELFHVDLCGQIRPQTVGGNLHFLLVVDDFSRFMWIELLKRKGEALSCLIKIK
jgi:hypothetical protein